VGVGALILERGRILLVERGREPLRGYWSLPGGAVETGEKLAEAVSREVREETGLRVEPIELFEVFERIVRDTDGRTEYHYVLLDYLCRVRGGELRAGDDVAQAAWVREAELGGYRITEGTLPVIRRAFRRLRRRSPKR
jgi:ADP-ribose pyrophosphatase YjhB (NUDIX family)